MSDNWTDEDLDDILGNTADNSTIKLLREKIKADNTALREMRSELDSLRNQNRGSLVEGALKSAGLKTGAAALYQGEANPDAIQAWVDANKDNLAREDGYTPPPPAGAQGDPESQTFAGAPAQGNAAPVFTPDTQMAYQRMISAGIDGQPGTNFTETLGSLQNANSMEELMGIIMSNQ